MKGYRLTPLALQDLHHLDEIVAESFGEDVASRAVDRLEETFEMLVDQPGVGTPRPEWTDLEVLF